MGEAVNRSQVARDPDLTETALRNRLNQAETDQGKGPEGAVTTVELEELRRLRREVRIHRMERDFAGVAAAFFAKDPDPPSS